MKYFKDENLISEDPFKLRPGTLVTVNVTLSQLNEYTGWDSDNDVFNEIITGAVFFSSIKGSSDIISTSITLDYTLDPTTSEILSTEVTIQPISQGMVDIDIYARAKDTANVTSFSALTNTSENLDGYKYIKIINNLVIPDTLMDIDGLFTGDVTEIDLEYTLESRGVCEFNGEVHTINNMGKFNSNTNVFRKGLQEVWVHSGYLGEYIREDSNRRLIKIDNQECQISNLEFYGMENVGEVVFIMTSNGLYGFNKYDDFIYPIIRGAKTDKLKGEWNSLVTYFKGDTVTKDTTMYRYINTSSGNAVLTDALYWELLTDVNIFCWPSITGTDLSYTHDDSLGVANGFTIEKYKIRHDFVLLDLDDQKIWFREPFPDFEVT